MQYDGGILTLITTLLIGCEPTTVDSPDAPPDSTEPDTTPTDSAPPDTEPEDTAPPQEPEEEVESVPGSAWENPGVILIDTNGQTIVTETKITGWLEVVRDHDNTLTDLTGANRAWEGHVGIEIHGSSSSGFSKKNYRIELRDDDGDDLDYALMDLPSESDWILHGPYSDKTLIRNALAYALGRSISTGQWHPHTAFAELLINGDHMGTYVVVERIERGNERVDIASISDDDPTGGYIVKIDQNRGPGWRTDADTPIDYHTPKVEAITAGQDAWLKGWFNDMETMLEDDDFADNWPDWMDGDSFIDHYIINELARNVDGYRLSGYLHKDTEARGGRLTAGPLWDFNLGFGNANYCYCESTDGFVYDSLALCGYPDQEPFWWQRLLEDPAYTTALRCRWEDLRTGALSDDAITAHITSLSAEIAVMEERDHNTWQTLGVYVWPNYYIGETWEDEVDYLQSWTLDRALWLDNNLPGTCGK